MDGSNNIIKHDFQVSDFHATFPGAGVLGKKPIEFTVSVRESDVQKTIDELEQEISHREQNPIKSGLGNLFRDLFKFAAAIIIFSRSNFEGREIADSDMKHLDMKRQMDLDQLKELKEHLENPMKGQNK